MRYDTTIVPAAMAEKCRETGVHFAAEEFGNFQDSDRARCPWTRGTFEGESLPMHRDHELYEACEQIMDDAASAEWERLWDVTPA